jgi:hypothetical protein
MIRTKAVSCTAIFLSRQREISRGRLGQRKFSGRLNVFLSID